MIDRLFISARPVSIKLHANGLNNSQQCCVCLHRAKRLTLRTNSQKHTTTCNRVCKRTHHVTSNNVGSCWPIKLCSFAFLMPFSFKSIHTRDLIYLNAWSLYHSSISTITALNSHKDGTLYQSLFFQNILR